MITPEEMREMAGRLDNSSPWSDTKQCDRNLSLASRMLRSIAAEREELRQLLYDIHPDQDHDVVQKYYAYFEANPIPKGAE